jgi:hypothetical protein
MASILSGTEMAVERKRSSAGFKGRNADSHSLQMAIELADAPA